MTEPTGVPDPAPASDDVEEERDDRRAAVAIVAVLLVAAVVALAWWLLSDDDEEPAGTTTTEPATSQTTPPPASDTTDTSDTSESTEPTFTSTLTEEELATVVWPYQDTSRRFDDPVAAASSFATDFLGFDEPLVGELQQGDQRSGEVEIRPDADGPVTTVLVRQLGDDSWWVLGSSTADVTVAEPEAGATVTNPARVAGSARAFEGNVEVLVHEDGSTEPIGTGNVTGGGGGEAAPFEGTVDYEPGSPRWGAMVFRTTSAEDGRVWQATVLRVRLGG